MSRTVHVGDARVIRTMHGALVHLRKCVLDLIDELMKAADAAVRQYEDYCDEQDTGVDEEVYAAQASLYRKVRCLADHLQSDQASGSTWLARQADLLDQIANVQLDDAQVSLNGGTNGSGIPAKSRPMPPLQSPALLPPSQNAYKIEQFDALAMPPRFRWVRLEEMDLADGGVLDLHGKDFNKGNSPARFYELMDRFVREVLPVVNGLPVAEHIEALNNADTKAGRSGAGTLRETYTIFFSRTDDPVRVDIPLPGHSGLDIGAGRHRLRIAMEMGIPAVPAFDQGQKE